jgi:hypothetical protein
MKTSRESALGSERSLRNGSTVIVITSIAVEVIAIKVILIKAVVITPCPDANAAPTGVSLGSISRWAYQVGGFSPTLACDVGARG